MSRQPCPECGAPFPPGIPAGICPNCLLQLAVRGGGQADAASLSSLPDHTPTTPPFPAEQPGSTIGRYKLQELIGEGGFGTVWMAEQQEPLRRKVALKIIKLGMDTREVVARFEAERQALAMMDHPNIAHVFDGGSTGTGRPYFVMELVKGAPISDYCDARKLDTHRRLKLFVEVCQAVQHAHQKGIIHRDLKPSNVLVTELDGRAVPKVIDFGIAKATEQNLTEQTFFTRLNQVIGSPAYMSPEQAGLGSLDIDTRSDIYALGAILYELLAGRTPFSNEELRQARLDEVLRTIREREPPKPSTRLSSLAGQELADLAAKRSSPPARLIRLVRGELDWIAMKCLEKDRALRYDSANSLALDLQRYLEDEPVLARPPSTAYRARKFVRKHRAGVTIAAFVMILLAGAAAVSAVLAIRANRALRRVEEIAGVLRHRAYASDIISVQEASRANDLARASEVLERNRPKAGDPDLRHWEWRYLWKESRQMASAILPGHRAGIRSLSYSADGRWLMWGGEDGSIKTWDLQGQCEGRSFAESTGEPAVAVFSPRGNLLAAGVRRGLVKVWNAGSGEELMPLPHGNGWIRSVAFSPDGSLLACMGDHLKIELWDIARTNRLAQTDIGTLRDTYKTRMAFAPHQPWLAVGETDGQIRILELPTLRERLRFSGISASQDGITALAFSPDGKVLASASGYDEFSIELWDPGTSTLLKTLGGHNGWVTALAFSPDGTTLASASVDRTIRLWDARAWRERAVLRGHRHEIWTIAFSPDSQTLASGSWAGEVFLWAAPVLEEHRSPDLVSENVRDTNFSSDGRTLAGWHWDGSLSLRSASIGSKPRQLTELGTNNYGVLLSPDNRFLATGNRLGVVRLLNPVTLREERTVRVEEPARILPVGFSRDSRLLLTSSRISPYARCELWEVEKSRMLAAWIVGTRNHRMELSPDGRLAMTGDNDGVVHFWNASTGRELRSMGAHRSQVIGSQFSADGAVLVSGSLQGDLIVWDVRTLSPVATLQNPLGAIYSIALSPDGKRLATSGNWQQALQIWDLATREIIATFAAPGAMHDAARFSPDGNSIVTVNSAHALYEWRAPSFSETDAAR